MKKICSSAGIAAALCAYITLWVLNALLITGYCKLLGMGFLFVLAMASILAHKKCTMPMKCEAPDKLGVATFGCPKP